MSDQSFEHSGSSGSEASGDSGSQADSSGDTAANLGGGSQEAHEPVVPEPAVAAEAPDTPPADKPQPKAGRQETGQGDQPDPEAQSKETAARHVGSKTVEHAAEEDSGKDGKADEEDGDESGGEEGTGEDEEENGDEEEGASDDDWPEDDDKDWPEDNNDWPEDDDKDWPEDNNDWPEDHPPGPANTREHDLERSSGTNDNGGKSREEMTGEGINTGDHDPRNGEDEVVQQQDQEADNRNTAAGETESAKTGRETEDESTDRGVETLLPTKPGLHNDPTYVVSDRGGVRDEIEASRSLYREVPGADPSVREPVRGMHESGGKDTPDTSYHKKMGADEVTGSEERAKLIESGRTPHFTADPFSPRDDPGPDPMSGLPIVEPEHRGEIYPLDDSDYSETNQINTEDPGSSGQETTE